MTFVVLDIIISNKLSQNYARSLNVIFVTPVAFAPVGFHVAQETRWLFGYVYLTSNLWVRCSIDSLGSRPLIRPNRCVRCSGDSLARSSWVRPNLWARCSADSLSRRSRISPNQWVRCSDVSLPRCSWVLMNLKFVLLIQQTFFTIFRYLTRTWNRVSNSIISEPITSYRFRFLGCILFKAPFVGLPIAYLFYSYLQQITYNLWLFPFRSKLNLNVTQKKQ